MRLPSNAGLVMIAGPHRVDEVEHLVLRAVPVPAMPYSRERLRRAPAALVQGGEEAAAISDLLQLRSVHGSHPGIRPADAGAPASELAASPGVEDDLGDQVPAEADLLRRSRRAAGPARCTAARAAAAAGSTACAATFGAAGAAGRLPRCRRTRAAGRRSGPRRRGRPGSRWTCRTTRAAGRGTCRWPDPSLVFSSRIMYCSAALFIPTATIVRPLAFFSWHSGDMQ